MHHHELFLRARHRNVEHAHLLGLGLAPQRVLERLARKCRVLDAPLRIHAHWAKAKLRMHQHRALEVHVAEAPRKIRQNDHRELKPLRLVDRHDAHAAAHARALRRVRLPARKLGAQGADEGEEAQVSRALKVLAQLQKSKQVFLARLSVRHRAEHRHHMAGAVYLVEQLSYAKRRRPLAQRAQLGEKMRRFLALIGEQCIIKVAAFPLCTDLRELIGREAEER